MNRCCFTTFFFFFADSTLLWLAIITAIAVVISLNIGDSGFLNP